MTEEERLMVQGLVEGMEECTYCGCWVESGDVELVESGEPGEPDYWQCPVCRQAIG